MGATVKESAFQNAICRLDVLAPTSAHNKQNIFAINSKVGTLIVHVR